jgi:glycogen synthase
VNKLSLQQELGWVGEKKVPLLCIPGGMTDEQGGAEFQEVIDGILALDCQLIVRGLGSEEYGSMFTELEKQFPHRVKIIPDEDVMRRKMYAGCDMALFFSEDADELKNCLAYGTVPISPQQVELNDYNPVEEKGNAFIAEPHTSWSWFGALVRGIETFKLPYDFRTIQKQAMQSVKGEEE